jgi:2-polyprenyl-3-methyl-5-hydroxy-6-metoxy-1,4-benzoquinol methylase
MTERERISSKAQSFFDDLWARGDPWELETSDFERARYARLLALLKPSGYGRVLEIGCGSGTFSRLLAPLAQRLLALDVSVKAISAARSAHPTLDQIEYRAANIMDYDPKTEGPWDLIVMSETIYFLGWLYSFFDVCWLTSELYAATRPGGQLLLANTQRDMADPLLLPCVIRTYHDMFSNVDFQLKAEQIFRGQKNGVDLDVLISLYGKPD